MLPLSPNNALWSPVSRSSPGDAMRGLRPLHLPVPPQAVVSRKKPPAHAVSLGLGVPVIGTGPPGRRRPS